MNPDERRNKREVLQILEAMVKAFEHREEIFQAIASAETDEEALDTVKKVLVVGDIRAQTVLDMQARRWTAHQNRKIISQMEQVRQELEAP